LRPGMGGLVAKLYKFQTERWPSSMFLPSKIVIA